MSLVAGVDIGSLAAKAVIIEAGSNRILARVVQPTGWQPAEAGSQVLAQALEGASVARGQLARIVATGYGRVALAEADERLTEISCLARGVRHLLPDVQTAVDVGGQDSKVVVLDKQGYTADFALNDRCAAGTGRFLEVMARALGVELSSLGKLSLNARRPVDFSSTCTVFVESELVGIAAAGESRENMAAGLCRVIARQVALLLGQVRYEPPLALVGGVARNEGVRAALEDLLDMPVVVPAEPQTVCALGAALWGTEMI